MGVAVHHGVRGGHPSRELAYTLITSLTPEDRRATQRDLLDDYRRALAAGRGQRAAVVVEQVALGGPAILRRQAGDQRVGQLPGRMPAPSPPSSTPPRTP
ncbi:hypothetical protein MAHJHV29_49750 [Mycobacterium avium subsp. hominissuis]